MSVVKAEVVFERGQVVYSVLDDEAYMVRAYMLREGEPSYLCFSAEIGEIEFQQNELTETRNFM